MRAPMLLAGLLFGVLIGALFMGGLGAITGFTVAAGERTQNLGITLNSPGVVPLSLPMTLTSFMMTGTYNGSGSVDVQLVGPNGSWHVASYSSPKQAGNASFMLGKGGTVVQLAPDSLAYHHVFSQDCDETCQENMTGPYYLQIAVTGGSFTLTSITYESPELIQIPVEPAPDEINDTIVIMPDPETPGVPPHTNIASDCSEQTACGEGLACHVGYCISETGHLNVTDNTGKLVALFDKYGRVLLGGELYQATSAVAPENAFRISTAVGDAGWITDEGDLHLKGRLYEGVMEIPIMGSQNFIVRNPDENVGVVQGVTGDMYTKDRVVTGALP